MNLWTLKICRIFHLISKVKYDEKRQIEIVKASPLFDAKWYLEQNPDVKAKKISAARHYVKWGWKEGRNPSKEFDGNKYLEQYPELWEKNWCPLFHYMLAHKELMQKVNNKIKEKKTKTGKVTESADYKLIAKSKYFDKHWYLKMYPDVKKAGVDPVKHYLQFGWKEGHNPSKEFSTNDYLNLNDDVKRAKINPLLHYEKYGKKEGRCYLSFSPKITIIKRTVTKPIGVVYTCITGGYDSITQHSYQNLNWDYVCYTDNFEMIKAKKIGIWEIRPLAYNKLDNIRNARWHKTHPHKLFPEYKYSIWIDGNIDVLDSELYKKSQKLINSKYCIFAYKHPFRDCVYDEADAVINLKKDFPNIVKKEVKYLEKQNFPKHFGLNETGVLIRKHLQCTETMELWWWLIKQFSRRDQLSFNFALWKNNLKLMPANNNINLRDIKYYKIISNKNHIGKIIDTNNKAETLSIIIPVYNALEYLRKCLDSVEKVTNIDKIELILINDCSDVQTSEFLNNYKKKNRNCILLKNNKNLGFVKTCNKGLKIAKGDVVVLLNSDTIVPRNFYNKILYLFNKYNNLGIASPITSNSGLWNVELLADYSIDQMDALIEKTANNKFPDILCPEGFCFCIRKNIISEIGLFDEIYGKGYCEETDYAMRALNKGWSLKLINNLYVWHRHHASFTSDERQKQLKVNREIFWTRWKKLYDKYASVIDMTTLISQRKASIYQNILKTNQDINNNIISYGHNINLVHDIKGKNNVVKIMSANEESCLNITINGDNNEVTIINPYRLLNVKILIGNMIKINNCKIFIDEGLQSNSIQILAYENNSNLHIGKNCLFSWNIVLRLGEKPHLLISSKNNKILNKAGKIIIGNNVWLGEDCYLTSKAQIPHGCIVGAKAVVTKIFTKENCIIAGNPAAIHKKNITWK